MDTGTGWARRWPDELNGLGLFRARVAGCAGAGVLLALAAEACWGAGPAIVLPGALTLGLGSYRGGARCDASDWGRHGFRCLAAAAVALAARVALVAGGGPAGVGAAAGLLASALLVGAAIAFRPPRAWRGGSDITLDLAIVFGCALVAAWTLGVRPAPPGSAHTLIGQVAALVPVLLVTLLALRRPPPGAFEVGFLAAGLGAVGQAGLVLLDTGGSLQTAGAALAGGAWWAGGALIALDRRRARSRSPASDAAMRSARRVHRSGLALLIGLLVAMGLTALQDGPDRVLLAGLIALALLVTLYLCVALERRRAADAPWDDVTIPWSDLLHHVDATGRGGTGRPVALALIDVSELDQVEEFYGATVADHALRAAAVRLRNATRCGDTLARGGAGQFALLIRDTEPVEAAAIGSRIARAIDDLGYRLDRLDGRPVRAAVGIGVAEGGEAVELPAIAERALAIAGSAQKSRVRVLTRGSGAAGPSRTAARARSSGSDTPRR